MSFQSYTLGLAACAAVAVGFLSFNQGGSPEPSQEIASVSKRSPRPSPRKTTPPRPLWTGTEVTPSLISSMWTEGSYDEVLSAFDHWLTKDPQAAIAFLETAKAPIVRAHFADSLSDHLLTLPSREALDLVSSFRLIEQDFHITICMPSFHQWAERSPEEARDWLVNTEQNFLAYEIGRNSSFGENIDQLPKFLELPKSAARENLVTGALESWLARDPSAAIDFLNSVPASPAFDRATFNYLDTFIHKDPGAAKAWAESITNEGLRSMALQEVALAVKNSCPDCRMLYQSNANSNRLRQPTDHHARHSPQ